jgi:hypothetical protein
MFLALHRMCKAQKQAAYTYKDVKEELLLIGERPNLFVRVNAVTTEQPTQHRQSRDVNFGQVGARDRAPSQRPCRMHAKGQCSYGDRCLFVHGKGFRDRSRSAGKGFGGGAGRYDGQRRFDRSRSRGFAPHARPHHDRSRSRSRYDASEPCRDFERGQCRRERNCRFAHGNGGGGSPRRFAGARGSPTRSPTPRFGKGNFSRSPSREHSSHSRRGTPKGKGKW